jgi:hypothetical protein
VNTEAVLDVWDRYDNSDLSTEQVFARVQAETGASADIISDLLWHREQGDHCAGRGGM